MKTNLNVEVSAGQWEGIMNEEVGRGLIEGKFMPAIYLAEGKLRVAVYNAYLEAGRITLHMTELGERAFDNNGPIFEEVELDEVKEYVISSLLNLVYALEGVSFPVEIGNVRVDANYLVHIKGSNEKYQQAGRIVTFTNPKHEEDGQLIIRFNEEFIKQLGFRSGTLDRLSMALDQLNNWKNRNLI